MWMSKRTGPDKANAPSTLWGLHTAVKKFFSCILKKAVVDQASQNFLKHYGKHYETKKAPVFRTEDLYRFLIEASNFGEDLLLKFDVVIGLASGPRGEEMTWLLWTDFVLKKHSRSVGKFIELTLRKDLRGNKTGQSNVYIIPDMSFGGFNTIVYFTEYLSLCARSSCNRFFRRFYKKTGKFTAQALGKDTIAKMPSRIATFLKLPNADDFKGHSIRRSFGTNMAESGANLQQLMQAGK
jgi:hypothetical protein